MALRCRLPCAGWLWSTRRLLLTRIAGWAYSAHRFVAQSYVHIPLTDGPIGFSPLQDRGYDANHDCKTWTQWSIRRLDADRFELLQRITEQCFPARNRTVAWTLARQTGGLGRAR